MAGLTVIYVDTLFLLNAIVDYLLLLCSARLAGERLSRLRFALGALLGGLYAVALFLPGFGFLGRPLCRLSAAVLMVLTAFGGCRRLLRQVVIFFLLSCAFGGGVLAIGLLGGRGLSLGGGVLYSSMDLKIVLLSAAGCYAVITLIFRGAGRHTAASRELLPARLSLRERQVELTALVDTGNTLTDPVSGRPVMVAEGETLSPPVPTGDRARAGGPAGPGGGAGPAGGGPPPGAPAPAALPGRRGGPGPAAGGAGGPCQGGRGGAGPPAGGHVSHTGLGRRELPRAHRRADLKGELL